MHQKTWLIFPSLYRLTDNGINDKGVIPNDKPCAVPNCNDDNWCDVSLVCKLMEDL